MKILFIDTETGGIEENYNSLLSIGIIVWENEKILEKEEIFIKEDNYNVTEKAMKINKLDLKKIYEKGLYPSEAVIRILEIIEKNFNEKAVICGHNINFDIKFIKKLFEKVGVDYNKYFSYRSIDTASILKFLSLAGKFEKNDINSLDDIIEYFNLSNDNRHTALTDIELTVKIFNRLLKLIK